MWRAMTVQARVPTAALKGAVLLMFVGLLHAAGGGSSLIAGEGGGEAGDCSYNPFPPDPWCCSCVGDPAYGGPPYVALFCEKNYGGGGTYHCGVTCPLEDEPCWGDWD